MAIKDLNGLLVFVKVVEANSFSEAARRLNLPASTVSRRISELENQLGVRLLDRSTRNVRLTEIGTEILEHARQGAELSDAVDNIVLSKMPAVSGALRLCAPPSISDSLILPVVGGFQAAYPNVRVQLLITERIVDQIAEDVDIALKVGANVDPSLEARTLLTYRHTMVASPAYIESYGAPEQPQDLLRHRLLAFSFWKPHFTWIFTESNGGREEALAFLPSIAINDYSGLVVALLEGAGIGELPPIVQPDHMRAGRLVEVMPQWHLPVFNLTLVHLRDRPVSRPARLFKEFAGDLVPKLFPDLPV
jgi:DNA-binding transcriptional LysR family regulator